MEEQRGQCGTGTEKLPRSPGSCQSIVVLLHPERDQCRLRRRRRGEERREEKIPRVKGQEKRGFSWLSSTFAKRKNVLKSEQERTRVRSAERILHPAPVKVISGTSTLDLLAIVEGQLPFVRPASDFFSRFTRFPLRSIFFLFFSTHNFHTLYDFMFHRKNSIESSFYQLPCFIFIKFLLPYLNKTTKLDIFALSRFVHRWYVINTTASKYLSQLLWIEFRETRVFERAFENCSRRVAGVGREDLAWIFKSSMTILYIRLELYRRFIRRVLHVAFPPPK